MNSWPEPTTQLWARRDPSASSAAHAIALFGTAPSRVADAGCVAAAASPAAAALLDEMGTRVATLGSTLVTTPQRCVGSVRGPILWAATVSARSSAAGSHEVVVCATTRRSFDTPENRLLVAVLERLARARHVIESSSGDLGIDRTESARILEVARRAQVWRRHPRLADLRGARPTARELAGLRTGRHRDRVEALLTLHRRSSCPAPDADPLGLVDAWTARYHGFALHVLGVLAPTVELPEVFSARGNELHCGPVAWRHPRSDGTSPPGVSYRGVPLLPPPSLHARAPWSAVVPGDGVRISWDRPAGRLRPAASASTATRGGRTQYASSSSSSRSSR